MGRARRPLMEPDSISAVMRISYIQLAEILDINGAQRRRPNRSQGKAAQRAFTGACDMAYHSVSSIKAVLG